MPRQSSPRRPSRRGNAARRGRRLSRGECHRRAGRTRRAEAVRGPSFDCRRRRAAAAGRLCLNVKPRAWTRCRSARSMRSFGPRQHGQIASSWAGARRLEWTPRSSRRSVFQQGAALVVDGAEAPFRLTRAEPSASARAWAPSPARAPGASARGPTSGRPAGLGRQEISKVPGPAPPGCLRLSSPRRATCVP